MENRIKECQLDLYADRTSAAAMRANQLRFWFASMAYVLLCALRRAGLDQTHFANAISGSIRLKSLKIGALVQFSVRRIKVAMASACPAADVWGQAARHLAAASARGSPAVAPAFIPRPTETTSSLRRQRKMIPALFAPTGATRKHVRNTTNTAIGISAQSRNWYAEIYGLQRIPTGVNRDSQGPPMERF